MSIWSKIRAFFKVVADIFIAGRQAGLFNEDGSPKIKP